MNPIVVPTQSISPTPQTETKRFLHQIVEKSTTPFERLGKDYMQGQRLDPTRFTTYLQHWAYNLSSDGKQEKLYRFFEFANLTEADVHQLLAPAKLCPSAAFPAWSTILEAVMEADFQPVGEGSPLDPENPIPFEEILVPFARVFRERLQVATGRAYFLLSKAAHIEIEQFLLKGLGDSMEKVLFTGFERFLKGHLGASGLEAKETGLAEDHYYQLFINFLQKDQLRTFFSHYPVLARIVANKLYQYLEAFRHFLLRLEADRPKFWTFFPLKTDPGKVVSLNLGISDPHKGGEGVMILQFETGWKLVYKPRCMKIGLAYNSLCEWINERVAMPLKVLRILAGENYGWIEFAANEACSDEAAVQRYYERAGMLLAITYLLDSNDYHAENLIASGEHPVLVDFETLLQPQLKVDQGRRVKRGLGEITVRADTVLRAALLPMLIRSTKVPNDSMSGFGSIGDGAFTVGYRQYVQVNTDAMAEEHYQKSYEITSNLPRLAGQFQRLPAYEPFLTLGFESLYQLFVKERAFLLGTNSPLRQFHRIGLRFLFRSTQVYSSILSNMLKPEYLSDATLYGLRIEILARAYVTQDSTPAFWPILDAERWDMINRDVPCLEVDSNEENLTVGEDQVIHSYFQSSCLDYVHKKLNRMGTEDFQEQLDLIKMSVRGELNAPENLA